MQIPKNFGLKISGIYKITNIVNNKFYIGSSSDIYHRLKHHYSDLKNNKHHNKYLSRSFKKHGKANFKVEIIEKVEQKLLIEKEQYYIDTLKPEYNSATSSSDGVCDNLMTNIVPDATNYFSNSFITGPMTIKHKDAGGICYYQE